MKEQLLHVIEVVSKYVPVVHVGTLQVLPTSMYPELQIEHIPVFVVALATQLSQWEGHMAH